MQIEEIREALHKQPFEPFSLCLADGTERYVPHPDFVALGPRRRVVLVDSVTEALSILDPLLIVSLEYGGEMPKLPGRKSPEGGNP